MGPRQGAVLLAFALLNGSRFARGLIGLLELVQIAAGVYVLVKLDSNHQAAAIDQIVGALIVLYFLFGTDKAKSFFAR
jgi:hypothetical protein